MTLRFNISRPGDREARGLQGRRRRPRKRLPLRTTKAPAVAGLLPSPCKFCCRSATVPPKRIGHKWAFFRLSVLAIFSRKGLLSAVYRQQSFAGHGSDGTVAGLPVSRSGLRGVGGLVCDGGVSWQESFRGETAARRNGLRQMSLFGVAAGASAAKKLP